MSKVMVIYPPTVKHLGLLKDIEGREDVLLFEAGYKKTGRLLALFRKICLSKKINKIISIPCKSVWYKKLPITEVANDIKSILIIDGALNYIDNKQFKMLRKITGINIDLFLINSMEAKSLVIEDNKRKIKEYQWDHIYTFDKNDALKYGFVYKSFCYYSKFNLTQCENPKYDVYFIGGNKGGREKDIVEVFSYLNDNNITCDISIMSYKRTPVDSQSGIKYFSLGWKPYTEILNGVNNSRCIVEFIQKGQSGPSLRYYEAVCYNKKLLTNNMEIKQFPYYDERYMKTFERITDIDLAWIQEPINVDYHYKGEFSPNNLIDWILNKSEDSLSN